MNRGKSVGVSGLLVPRLLYTSTDVEKDSQPDVSASLAMLQQLLKPESVNPRSIFIGRGDCVTFIVWQMRVHAARSEQGILHIGQLASSIIQRSPQQP